MRKVKSSITLETLGCKLNQAESESLAWQLAERGYNIVSASDGADIYILNTCTVTHIADRKSRHLLRLARRRNPSAFIIATGCYAERATSELAQVADVDMIIGNKEKPRLLDVLEERGLIVPGNPLLPQIHRTRSLLKVHEGCNRFCSYCIVPLVRGRERSLPPDEALAEVRARVERGYREVVLTGTQIGSYRNGLGYLIRRIIAETDVQRLRLSSLQPQDITPALLTLWQDFTKHLCRHIHLPLQSGSNAVLHRMGRSYSMEDFEQAVSSIRESIPDVAITTDVIVGFPGETVDEYAESYSFCQRMAFSNIHVFTYSERPGTRAALLPYKIDERVKKERSQRMLKLAEESARSFRERFVGHTMMVLWEQEIQEGTWAGLTDNYIRVVAHSEEPLRNRLIPASLGNEHYHYLGANVAQ